MFTYGVLHVGKYLLTTFYILKSHRHWVNKNMTKLYLAILPLLIVSAWKDIGYVYILNLILFCFNFRKTYLAWNVTYPIVAQPTNETLEPPPFNLTIYKGKKALVEEWYSDSSPLIVANSLSYKQIFVRL